MTNKAELVDEIRAFAERCRLRQRRARVLKRLGYGMDLALGTVGLIGAIALWLNYLAVPRALVLGFAGLAVLTILRATDRRGR